MFSKENNDPVGDKISSMNEEDLAHSEEQDLTDEELAEFSLLDRQLDQLDRALDAIEEKNDSIHDKLKDLLEESRQARLNDEKQ